MSQLLQIYNYMKQHIIERGYERELEFYKNIPSLDQMSKWYFFSEYCWVVLHAGINYKATRNVYDTFWNNGELNFDAIKHKSKNNAIKKIYTKLDKYFNQYKNSKNKLKFLESLDWIGSKTKYHLAKNLGFNYAKPDRHLTRIASFFKYENVQEFCEIIAQLSNDERKIVDTVCWRFANLNTNYLEILEKLQEKRE